MSHRYFVCICFVYTCYLNYVSIYLHLLLAYVLCFTRVVCFLKLFIVTILLLHYYTIPTILLFTYRNATNSLNCYLPTQCMYPTYYCYVLLWFYPFTISLI